MATLRTLLETLGYTEVRTLLNSGNVIFTARRTAQAQLAATIRAALCARFGFEIPVVVKPAAELASVIAENPWPEADPSKLLIGLAQEHHELGALSALETLVWRPEHYAVGAHAAFLFCPAGIRNSKAATALLGRATLTTRNWATLLKLHSAATSER